MKENTRIELTQDQYDALSAIGVADCEIKTIGCTMSIGGPSSDHHMTVGIKTRVTGGNNTIDNIDTTPIQVESLAGGAEWKNGDECIYMGHKVVQQFIGPCPKRYGYGYIQAPTFEVNFVELSKLSKPETEAERNYWERMEAAYDLYVIAQLAIGGDVIDYSDFVKESRQMRGALAIIDKTGYRKAVTNE